MQQVFYVLQVFYDSCFSLAQRRLSLAFICPTAKHQKNDNNNIDPTHTVNSPTNLKSRELAPTLTINLPAGTTHSCFATSQ